MKTVPSDINGLCAEMYQSVISVINLGQVSVFVMAHREPENQYNGEDLIVMHLAHHSVTECVAETRFIRVIWGPFY